MDYNLSGVHGVNKYLWSELQTLKDMAPSRYENFGPFKTPIIPTQQERAFTEMIDASDAVGGVPFLVYNWTTSVGVDWFMRTDDIAYVIYSQSEGELRRISNMMVELFKDWEQAAYRVNDFILDQGNGSAAMKAFEYKTISVTQAGGPLPITEEGGRHRSLVTIRVDYTVSR